MSLFCTLCTSWHCQPRRHGHSCSGVVTAWRFSAGGALYPRTSVVVGTGYPRTGPDRTESGSWTPRPAPPVRRSLVAHVNQVDKTKGESRYRRRDGAARRSQNDVGVQAWSCRGRRRPGATAGTRQSDASSYACPSSRAPHVQKKHGAVLLLLLPTVMLGREKGRLEIKRGELDGDAVRSCRNSRYSVGGRTGSFVFFGRGVVVRTYVQYSSILSLPCFPCTYMWT